MANAEQLNHAKAFLRKAQEYLASAEDNLDAQRHTPATGDAIHAGINAKDAKVTALAGATRKSKDHTTAAKELRAALGQRTDAAPAEKALRELIAAKGEVEYSITLISATRAGPQVKRARLRVVGRWHALPRVPVRRFTPHHEVMPGSRYT